MGQADQDIIKKILIVAIFVILLIVAFLLIYPFVATILTALVLAYVCRPFYNKLDSKLKRPNISSFLICTLILIVAIAVIFFLAKVVVKEVIVFYSYIQTTDLLAPIKVLFASAEFPSQISILFDQALATGISGIMNSISATIMDMPMLFLKFFIMFFILFYFLRDSVFLANYFKNVLPFRKNVREQFFSRFRKITRSVIYGTFLFGALGGVLTGVGFFIFNIPNAFILTVVAIVLGILPIVGPSLIWIPAAVFMAANGDYINAAGLILYCTIATGIIPHLMLGRYVGKRAAMSNAVALIGMLGGLKLLGIIGLIIGPLILDYLILFVEFYKKGQIKRLI